MFDSEKIEVMAHSPVGPSSSKQWMTCPGSVARTKDLPDTSSEAADEGSFGHYISELARLENKHVKHYLGKMSDCGRFECDSYMVDYIQEYVDYCAEFEGEMHVELRVCYDEWAPYGFGTADDIRINADGGCKITDLKYGKSPDGIVYAKNEDGSPNTQLLMYALGVYQELDWLYDFTEFHLAIHQPRLGHVDEVSISTEELLDWADNVLRPAAAEVWKEDAEVNPGTDAEHCHWCKGKNGCKPRADLMSSMLSDELDDVDGIDTAEFTDPKELSPKQLGKLLDNVKKIESWCKGAKEHGLSELNAGRPPVGESGEYKLVAGRATRGWEDEAEAEKQLKSKGKLKVADIFPKKLISVPQAEKLLGKKHPLIDEYSAKTLVEKSAGKSTMVPASDKRPPLETASVDELDD